MCKEAVIHYHIFLYLIGYVAIKVIIGFCSKISYTSVFLSSHIALDTVSDNSGLACAIDGIPLSNTVLLDAERFLMKDFWGSKPFFLPDYENEASSSRFYNKLFSMHRL